MLLTLAQLLVIVLLPSGALALGVAGAQIAGLDEGSSLAAGALCGILVPLLAGWPLFKLLSLRPLILPRCPSCGKRHVNYHIPREAWPVVVIICASCGSPLRLVLRRGAGPADPAGVATLTLRWPGFLGLWRPSRPFPPARG